MSQMTDLFTKFSNRFIARSNEQLIIMLVIGISSVSISSNKVGWWHDANFYAGVFVICLSILIFLLKILKYMR